MPADKLELLWPLGFDAAALLLGIDKQTAQRHAETTLDEAFERVTEALEMLGLADRLTVRQLKPLLSYALLSRASVDELRHFVDMAMNVSAAAGNRTETKLTGAPLALLQATIAAVLDKFQKRGLAPEPRAFAALCIAAYELAAPSGKPPPDSALQRLVDGISAPE